MRLVDDEGNCATWPNAFYLGGHPSRVVSARKHLAEPQDGEFAIDFVCCDAMCHAKTLSAAFVQAKHQSRFLRCAAAHFQRQAEVSVIALDPRGPAFGNLDRGI